MSVVRRKPDRSNRAVLSSPYSRPTTKQSWSFSRFLNYILPSGRYESTEEEESLSSDEDKIVGEVVPDDLPPPSPAQKLSRRGQELAETGTINGCTFAGPPPSARRNSSPAPLLAGLPNVDFTFQVSSSASRNLDTVTNFLTSHANQPIATEDINQMVALIQQSKPEPFRFETRAATSPPRSKSPSEVPRGSSFPRTLSRNPNGSYTWKGAGSARNRRTRNDYSSPAFRMPRTTVSKRSSSSIEVSGNDTKRRRVEEQKAPTSSVQSQPPQPSASQTNTTGQLLKPPSPISVRQRTPGLSKPTTPVVPSPLRQAWTGGSPSGSEPGSPQGPSTLKQTETAKHVTELVNNLKSQDKVLDELRNPYELAIPVKRPTAPKRKRAPKKSEKTAKSKEGNITTIKIKEMSAHAIIEATLPEGSKRSRPPPELERQVTVAKEPLKVLVIGEESEELPASKRPMPQENGRTVAETTDVDMQSPIAKDKKEKLPSIKVPVVNVPPQPSSVSKSLFGPKSSMPKEPSKLRFSMQPESVSTPPSPRTEHKVEVQETTKSSLSSGFTLTPAAAPVSEAPKRKEITQTTNFFTAPPPPPAPVTTPTPSAVPQSARDIAKSQSLASLPSFTFGFPAPSAPGTSRAQDEAKAIATASLPSFDLTKSVAPPASSIKAGFDWSAAGMKAPTPPTGGEWICDSCMLANPASAMTKCRVCETPKLGTVPPNPTTFNWGAAGLKPAVGPTNGEWICSECALLNPASATAQCTICEALKPGGVAELPKTTPTFDWKAAGMKPTTEPAEGDWVCNECSLKNTASSTTKCAICEAPRPGIPAAETPKSAAFDWAAAGMKAPTAPSAGEWTCRTCGLQNPADVKSKCTICESVRS